MKMNSVEMSFKKRVSEREKKELWHSLCSVYLSVRAVFSSPCVFYAGFVPRKQFAHNLCAKQYVMNTIKMNFSTSARRVDE